VKKLVLALALALVALSPLVAAPLGKKELKELKAKLGAALNSGDWDAAGEHLKAMAKSNDKKVWKLMVKVVEKSPPQHQLELVLADAAKEMTDPGVQKEVRKTAVKSRQSRIRRVLMSSLAAAKDWDSLIKALKDKDEQTAAMAAWALIDNKVEAGVEPMIEQLEKVEKDQSGIWDVLNKGLGQLLGMRLNSAIEYRSRWELVKAQGGLNKVERPKTGSAGGGEVKTMVRVKLFDREIDCSRIVFILDVSGSMKAKDPDQQIYDDGEEGTRTRKGAGESKVGEDPEANLLTRLERAQRQLKKVIKHLPKNFKINIVAYSSHVKLWRSFDGDNPPQLHELTDKNRKEAMDFVDSFKAAGVTATDTALRRAFEVEGARCFYLLSDGTATHDGTTQVPTSEILAVLDEFEARHVTVHTLGFKGADVEMMKAVAEKGAGKYSDIK